MTSSSITNSSNFDQVLTLPMARFELDFHSAQNYLLFVFFFLLKIFRYSYKACPSISNSPSQYALSRSHSNSPLKHYITMCKFINQIYFISRKATCKHFLKYLDLKATKKVTAMPEKKFSQIIMKF